MLVVVKLESSMQPLLDEETGRKKAIRDSILTACILKQYSNNNELLGSIEGNCFWQPDVWWAPESFRLSPHQT